MIEKEHPKNIKKSKLDNLNFYIEAIAKFCDKCGSAYSVDNLKIIKENDFSSIIHFSCMKCKSRHIATFVKPLGMSSRMPVNSDLSIDEVIKFSQGKEVLIDDILNIYSLLQKDRAIKV